MLYAAILACSVLDPTACFEIEDTRGPYATRDECVVRVGQMIEDVSALLGNKPHVYRFKCQPKGRPV